MKKALCLLKKGDENSHVNTIKKAKIYASEKGYEYAGSYLTELSEIFENKDKIMTVLEEGNIEVILTDNELPVYAKIFKNDNLLSAVESERIQWYDIDNDCLVKEMVDTFVSQLEKEMLERHVPVMIVFEGAADLEKDDNFQKIALYIKEVLNQNACTVMQYEEDNEYIRDNLIQNILKYTPRYIILNKEFQSESARMVLEIIKNAFDYDMIISFDEVEQALRDNDVVMTFSDLKS